MKKILIVDDDPDIVTITKFILENENFLVLSGGSAEEALDTLKQEVPDVILLDLSLPKMQGWELAKLLKKQDHYKQIPILFLVQMPA